MDTTLWGEPDPEEDGELALHRILSGVADLLSAEDESSEEEEEEEDDEDGAETATDGLRTPSGLETPSGLHSVVSTVPGGLETPDFLELRKGRDVSESPLPNRSLYQVVPEKQTAVRGLMGSERGYDVTGLSNAPAANVPVLGDERGSKVRSFLSFSFLSLNVSCLPSA